MVQLQEKIQDSKYSGWAQRGADYGIHVLPALAHALPDDPAACFTVLEIGCGAGHVAGGIARSYPHATVFATDLLPRCVELTQANYPELQVRQVDADEPLPFADATVDVVVSCNLFEHIHDERRHLQEVHRLLAPGGVYFISTPHLLCDMVWTLVDPSVRERTRQLVGRLRKDVRIAHCNLKTVRSLKRVLRECGFQPRPLRRESFSNLERQKLELLCRWLPQSLRQPLCRVCESCWRRLPQAFQPTIAMLGRKHGPAI